METSSYKNRIEEMYILYSDEIYNQAYMITNDAELCEEIVSMVFEWYCRRVLVHNEFNNIPFKKLLRLTTHISKKMLSEKQDMFNERTSATIVNIDPADVVYHKEQHYEIVKCIANIKRTYSHTLVLNLLHDMKPAQISKELLLKKDTVKKKIKRGKKLLASTLIKMGYDI